MSTSTVRRRISRRTAIATVALMSIAVPASASVIIQNFIVANVTSVAACFTKTAGNDAAFVGGATGPTVGVSTTPTVTVGGVALLNETISIRGFAGDRTRYTDVIRYKNNCNMPVTIRLVGEADPSTGATVVGSPWDKIAVQGFLSAIAVPALPAAGTITTDLSVAGSWNKQFSIDNTGVVTAAGAAQTVAAGAELQGAFIVDIDSTMAAATVRTFHFTASASA